MKVRIKANTNRVVEIEADVESIAELAIACNPDFGTGKRSKPELALLKDFGNQLVDDHDVDQAVQRRQAAIKHEQEASDGKDQQNA